MKAWLGSQGFENAFLDRDKTTGIPPPADWEKTLYRKVEQSRAVIIIQTPDWLASKWCFAEFGCESICVSNTGLSNPIPPARELEVAAA